MLTIIQVGHDDASDRYIRNKVRAIEREGLEAHVVNLDKTCTTQDVIQQVLRFTSTAIMVQLPLPAHIDKDAVLCSIPPAKDIDGLNPHSGYEPLTPSAIMRWLSEQNVELAGKNVAILGRSELVGKPLANMMMKAGATVSVLNSKTSIDAHSSLCNGADIIVSAVGKPNTVTLDDVLGNVGIVIDVGINRDEKGELCGDVSADAAEYLRSRGHVCTPVPGGVGKWTVRELVLRLREMEKNAAKTRRMLGEPPTMPEETEVCRVMRNKVLAPVLYVHGKKVSFGDGATIDISYDGSVTYDVRGVRA